MTPADLRVHIRQLCCLGLPSEQLVPPLLKAVRQLVGADSAGFFWVDAEGDMTSLYAERLLPPSVMRLYFERYYESDESSFRRSFTERLRQNETVAAMSASEALQRTPYYNEVFRRLDAHHVLYGIVRDHGQAIGQLSLYRPKSASPFSAAQRSELSTIMRYVTHGIAQHGRSGADAKEFLDTDDDAVFLIGADAAIRQISLNSQKLLTLATQGRIGPQHALTVDESTLRPTLLRLAERLRSVLSGGEGGPPSLVLQSPWGRFVLRAYAIGDPPVEDDANIAIRIQRQETKLLRFVDALNELELSPRQRDVAVGLAKGASNRELAAAMGVSINTIAYHVKQLFQRLDSHDRQQMIAKVLATGPRRS
jgi:DNA-binding CsgD family transcriptional regulator